MHKIMTAPCSTDFPIETYI